MASLLKLAKACVEPPLHGVTDEPPLHGVTDEITAGSLLKQTSEKF